MDAVPKLLHRIWNDARVAVSLRTDESPHRIPKGLFIDNAAKRCEVLETAAEWAREMRGGVLILMDADADCCKKLLNEKQMKKVRGDIACILAGYAALFLHWRKKDMSRGLSRDLAATKATLKIG